MKKLVSFLFVLSLCLMFVSFAKAANVGDSNSRVSNSNNVTPALSAESSMKILYPKGGETFHPGDKVTVAWSSSEIPVGSKILLRLNMDRLPGAPAIKCGTLGRCLSSKEDRGDSNLVTENTGLVDFTLPLTNLPTYNKYYFSIEAYKDYVDASGVSTHASYGGNITGDINGPVPVVGFFSISSTQAVDSLVDNNSALSNTQNIGLSDQEKAQKIIASQDVFNRNLQVGSKGVDVKALQQLLQTQGYLPATAKIDGSYGKATLQAVAKYQKANGLTPVGTVGSKTLEKIKAIKDFKATKTTVSNIVLSPNPQPISDCDATSESFKVLSPNGGEVFTVGQTITVKWSSCNLSSSFNDLFVALHKDGNWQNVIFLTNATVNSGIETFVIPSTVTPGNYKIRIGSAEATIGQDFSDNLFTINAQSGTKKDGNVSINRNACTPDIAPWIKVLSPNGGETFTAGQQITIKWTSCNIPATAQVGLVFDYVNPNVLSSQQYSFSFLLPPNYTTVNDGSEVVTIPASGYFSNLGQVQYHGLYKARIIYIQSGGSVLSATSDNSFTIN